MVYDEGFDFSFGEINTPGYGTYFTFSKYGLNDRSNEKIATKWVSYCYSTLIGWYQEGEKYGCFVGTKVGVDPNEVTNGEASNKQVVVEGSMTEKTFLETNQTPREEIRFMESKYTERIELTANFKDHSKVVERINAENLSWKAAVYSEFEGKTVEQLNKLAGRKKSRNGMFADFSLRSDQKKTMSKNSFHKFINSEKRARKSLLRKPNRKNEPMPEEFNWKEYMGPPKSQVKKFQMIYKNLQKFTKI